MTGALHAASILPPVVPSHMFLLRLAERTPPSLQRCFNAVFHMLCTLCTSSFLFFTICDILYNFLSLSRFSLFPSQAEIVKRLSAICAQIIPFLSQEVRVTTARHAYRYTQNMHTYNQERIIHTPGPYHIYFAFRIINEPEYIKLHEEQNINSELLGILSK